MSGNFAIKGGGVGRLMANAILNFHFDFWHPSLRYYIALEFAPFECSQGAEIYSSNVRNPEMFSLLFHLFYMLNIFVFISPRSDYIVCHD